MGGLFEFYTFTYVKFVHEFSITIRDFTTTTTISIVSDASHCRLCRKRHRVYPTFNSFLSECSMPHVFTRVCVIRRRKMVAGMVGGEEDRMTMKTSDLPVCLLYILLCCSVYPNAHRNLTHIVRDFVHTTGLCAPAGVRLGGGSADR